jgi:succinyl-CoA synthetase beta subunit
LFLLAGIMRCDYIAEGVIKATKELKLEIPLVVRLKGTMEQEAKRYITIFFAENINQRHFLILQNDQGLGIEDHSFR